jgi:hypothetical protein
VALRKTVNALLREAQERARNEGEEHVH